MNLYSFPVSDNGTHRTCLTIIDPADAAFSKKSVVGFLIDDLKSVTHHNIRYNPEFIKLFHKIIVLTAIQSQEVMADASIQWTGFVYITDQRNPATDADKQEDIIGSFEVHHGTMMPLSYHPNPLYQLISDAGLFKIPGEFDQYLELAVKIKD